MEITEQQQIKTCPRCKTEKLLLEFTKDVYSKDGLKEYCRSCIKIQDKSSHNKIRLEVLSNYGLFCVCCGETKIEFLTIDHINGNGAEHTRLTGKGTRLYYWLKRNNYPKDNYQVLCFNCNCAKGQNGRCPHNE